MQLHQLTRFDEFRNKLITRISEQENLLKAIDLIVFNPKVDGSERANFQANFAFRGLGETFLNYKTRERYVIVTPMEQVRYIEKGNIREGHMFVTGLNLKTSWLTTEDAKKVGLDHLERTDNTFYFHNYEPRISRDEWDRDEFTAERALNIIRGQFRDAQVKRLENLKKELERLPQAFQEMLDMVNQIDKFKQKFHNTEFLHEVAYQVLDNPYMYTDLHY